MSESDGIRINKYIASCGVCSRREADKLVMEGNVTINGKMALTGDVVYSGDCVKLGSKLLQKHEESTVLAFYKPVGVTCTEKDEHAELTIKDVLRFKERVTYAGRLDKDSEGLLILTNDGDLIDAMMRSRNMHEKEYIVTVNKPVTAEFVDNMQKGVYLNELKKKTRPCTVKKVGKETFSIVLTEGLNRQIRRMCGELGYKVKVLKRVRVVSVTLDGLMPGQYRILGKEEIAKLKGIVYGSDRR